MPPQEGCLEVEFGFDLPGNEKDLSRMFYVRSIRYIGALSLPENRQGERSVADDTLGTPLEHVRLKKKAYWMATVLLADQSHVQPRADGKELINLKRFSLPDARRVINETNTKDKAALLMRCLDAAEQTLFGAARTA
jgi:hypothetical protein